MPKVSLLPHVVEEVYSDRWNRVGGGIRCKECGKEYYDHPEIVNILDFQGDPFLNLICTGEVVKL